MDAVASWSTRANALSFVRVLLAPALALAVLRGEAAIAAWIFTVAVATDLADGWVARRYDEATPRGGCADHAADAVFVSVGSAALASTGQLPVLLPGLIALAFTQYALDSRAIVRAGLRPSRLGRWNGVAYYAIVAVPVVRDALALDVPSRAWVLWLGWALVASTLVSMADRLRYWLRTRGR